MPRPLPMTDQFVDLTFPTFGVDLSRAHASQRPNTTALGENVRTFEALTDRGRGGSRPGLTRYINEKLPLE